MKFTIGHFNSKKMSINFINDPDGYWHEFVPVRYPCLNLEEETQ